MVINELRIFFCPNLHSGDGVPSSRVNRVATVTQPNNNNCTWCTYVLYRQNWKHRSNMIHFVCMICMLFATYQAFRIYFVFSITHQVKIYNKPGQCRSALNRSNQTVSKRWCVRVCCFGSLCAGGAWVMWPEWEINVSIMCWVCENGKRCQT